VKSLEKLLEAMPLEKSLDSESQILAPIPTVLLIKANGQIFGGYASQPWRTDGIEFGNSRCFLFSLSKDIKIPFQGRDTLPVNPETVKFCQENELPVPKFSVLKSDRKILQFGPSDLVIHANFTNCSSELEHSFGIRLPPGSQETRTLLAGSEIFNIDSIELWGVYDGDDAKAMKKTT